ncbi:MAG: SMC-Scp complex subunit ScpB, partial [Thermomicrobiales bacterium]
MNRSRGVTSGVDVIPTPVVEPASSGQDRLIAQRMSGFPSGQEQEIPLEELPALLEALLLAAPGPVPLSDLARVAGWPVDIIRESVNRLEERSDSGWVVHWHGTSIQLATNPRYAEQVRQLLGYEREARLSAASLETLAIIAYQQPVTRSAIESVRGVESSGVLTTLLNRGLVESRQRMDLLGQP